MKNIKNALQDERGNILFLLLLAVGLFGALSYSISSGTNNSAGISAQKTFQTEKELMASIAQIQSAVQQCTLLYPGGLSGQPNVPYPLAPDDTVLPADGDTDPDNAVSIPLEDMICPGNLGDVFDSSDGNFLPSPISGMGDWEYTNNDDNDGVYLQITATNSQPHVTSALNRVIEETSSCEAALNADPDGNGACGAVCLTIWLKNPDTGC